MINRNTFYLHFEDIVKFLKYYYSECLEYLRISLGCFEKKASGMTPDHFNICVKQLVANIDRFSFIYKTFLSGKIYSPFLESMDSVISAHTQIMIKIHYKTDDKNFLDISSKYFTSGLIGVVIFWMNNKVNYSSEDIIETVRKLYT
jgi:hypothetical protein